MRSTLKDSGLIAVSGSQSDAASGGGIALGGGNVVPFTMTRTGTGDYTFFFDAAVMPFSVAATGSTGQTAVTQVGAGTFRLLTFNTTGAAIAATTRFVLTARDGRR